MSALARLPVRWRVTATFTIAAAVVLGALGAYLHVQLARQLDDSVASGLQQRLRDVTSLLGGDPARRFDLLEQQDGGRGDHGGGARDVTQLLTTGGAVVASEAIGDGPVLTSQQRARARAGDGEVFTLKAESDGRDDRVALLAGPVPGGVVAVGAPLDQRDEAVQRLDQLLAVGLPGALLFAALAGLWGSRVALSPVDRMRERAEVVGFADPQQRLPEGPANDELRRLAQTLNRMLDRLQEGYDRERSFVDDAAHELRTPLTLLRGELELAAMRTRSVEQLEATVGSARKQTERLVALANDLLILARSADGRLPLRREPLRVLEHLEAAAARAAPHQGAREIVVDPLAASAGTFEVDRLRLEQVLDNLLVNALDHGEGRVVLGASRDGADVIITVDDDGPGIGTDLAVRAFDRFARGDAARATGGAGLGLAIVRAIVLAHGGEAGLEPRPGRGTRAWLRVPATAP